MMSNSKESNGILSPKEVYIGYDSYSPDKDHHHSDNNKNNNNSNNSNMNTKTESSRENGFYSSQGKEEEEEDQQGRHSPQINWHAEYVDLLHDYDQLSADKKNISTFYTELQQSHSAFIKSHESIKQVIRTVSSILETRVKSIVDTLYSLPNSMIDRKLHDFNNHYNDEVNQKLLDEKDGNTKRLETIVLQIISLSEQMSTLLLHQKDIQSESVSIHYTFDQVMDILSQELDMNNLILNGDFNSINDTNSSSISSIELKRRIESIANIITKYSIQLQPNDSMEYISILKKHVEHMSHDQSLLEKNDTGSSNSSNSNNVNIVYLTKELEKEKRISSGLVLSMESLQIELDTEKSNSDRLLTEIESLKYDLMLDRATIEELKTSDTNAKLYIENKTLQQLHEDTTKSLKESQITIKALQDLLDKLSKDGEILKNELENEKTNTNDLKLKLEFTQKDYENISEQYQQLETKLHEYNNKSSDNTIYHNKSNQSLLIPSVVMDSIQISSKQEIDYISLSTYESKVNESYQLIQKNMSLENDIILLNERIEMLDKEVNIMNAMVEENRVNHMNESNRLVEEVNRLKANIEENRNRFIKEKEEIESESKRQDEEITERLLKLMRELDEEKKRTLQLSNHLIEKTHIYDMLSIQYNNLKGHLDECKMRESLLQNNLNAALTLSKKEGKSAIVSNENDDEGIAVNYGGRRYDSSIYEETIRQLNEQLNSALQRISIFESAVSSNNIPDVNSIGYLTNEVKRLEYDNNNLSNQNKILLNENRTLLDQNRNLSNEIGNISEQQRILLEKNRSFLEQSRSLSDENKILSEKHRILLEQSRLYVDEKKFLLESNTNVMEENRNLIHTKKTLEERNKLLNECVEAMKSDILEIEKKNNVLSDKYENHTHEKNVYEEKYNLLQQSYHKLSYEFNQVKNKFMNTDRSGYLFLYCKITSDSIPKLVSNQSPKESSDRNSVSAVFSASNIDATKKDSSSFHSPTSSSFMSRKKSHSKYKKDKKNKEEEEEKGEERDEENRLFLSVRSNQVTVLDNYDNRDYEDNISYHFDKIYNVDMSILDIFNEMEPILTSILYGESVCLLNYGSQQSTHKGSSLFGSKEDWGIVLLTLQQVFNHINTSAYMTYPMSPSNKLSKSSKRSKVYLSIVCLDNDKDIIDLTLSNRTVSDSDSVTTTNTTINNNSNSNNGTHLLNETMIECQSFEEAYEIYDKALIKRDESLGINRDNKILTSHLFIQIKVHTINTIGNTMIEGNLMLVELADSERVKPTESNAKYFRDSQLSQRSLNTLRDVLCGLCKANNSRLRRPITQHIPYKYSKLTSLLEPYLQPKLSKVLILSHISSDEDKMIETKNTLSYTKLVQEDRSNH